MRNSEVSQNLRGAVGDDDEEWYTKSRIPALQIWAKMYHKYEGMTDMLTGTMMEELAKIITCVTGPETHAIVALSTRRIKTLNVSARP